MSNLEAGDTIVHVPLSAVISRPFVETALCSHLKVSNLSTQVLFWENLFFFSCLSSRLFFLFGCFMKRVTEGCLVHILNLFPLNTQTLTFAQTKRSSVCLRVCQKRCCSKRSWSRRTTTSSWAWLRIWTGPYVRPWRSSPGPGSPSTPALFILTGTPGGRGGAFPTHRMTV